MESYKNDSNTRFLNISPRDWNYDEIQTVWAMPSAMDGIIDENRQPDAELLYHADTDTYSFEFNCDYAFTSNKEKIKYLQRIYKGFANFMKSSKLEMHKMLPYYDVFAEGISPYTCYNTIEDCFAGFKVLYHGYITLAKKVEDDAI